MLNKDQYNQDEYNDYYKQAREGAEIHGYKEEESGFMGKVILLLGLIALGVAGYFGFKAYSSTTKNAKEQTKEKVVQSTANTTPPKDETSEKKVTNQNSTTKISNNKKDNEAPKTTQEKNTQKAKEEVKDTKSIEESIKEEVATQVQEKLKNKKNMSTEDISKIVDLVMNKIDTEETDAEKSNNDADLLSALENSDQDVVKEVTVKEVEVTTDKLENSVEKELEDVNTYNKVTVESQTKSNHEKMDELSKQITKLLNESNDNESSHQVSHATATESINVKSNEETTVSNYEESLTPEIKVRSNAMRIIVVRKGDTLNKIAQRAYGKASSYQKIFDANPDILKRPDRIYVGQKLRIPK